MPSSTTTPNPSSKRKKPQDRKPASTRHGSTWKRPLIDLELPSGETCQVRRVGIERLMKEGLLHSMDTLTAVVQQETIPRAAGKPVTDIKSVIEDPDKFERMLKVVDEVVCLVVTEPKVLNHRVPVLDENDKPLRNDDNDPVYRELTDDERDADAVYADYIDLQDRVFIMNFAVGGSADLDQFRAEAEASVGGLSAGDATAVPTE